jgi:acetoin utilization deacetylase AcuC-like enzyme
LAAVALYHHPACGRHDTGWGHPEHQGRLRAIHEAIERVLPDLHGDVEPREGRLADRAILELVHVPAHLDRVERAAERARAESRPVRLDLDTVVSGASWEAARAVAGCAIEAVETVCAGDPRAAFCAIRPPGHHATPDRAMGFCLVNGVAVAARHALGSGLAGRVLIVDWDVHHGNGTQEIFYADPTVFYLSLHQSPFYPGTGAAAERGDPLGGFTLEEEHFRTLTLELVRRTASSATGRVVSVLEGGYNPPELGRNAVAHLRALRDAALELG